MIVQETDKVYKKEKEIQKGIAFPTQANINNCICHYAPLSSVGSNGESHILFRRVYLGYHTKTLVIPRVPRGDPILSPAIFLTIFIQILSSRKTILSSWIWVSTLMATLLLLHTQFSCQKKRKVKLLMLCSLLTTVPKQPSDWSHLVLRYGHGILNVG